LVRSDAKEIPYPPFSLNKNRSKSLPIKKKKKKKKENQSRTITYFVSGLPLDTGILMAIQNPC
jgi:hypothetical protein